MATRRRIVRYVVACNNGMPGTGPLTLAQAKRLCRARDSQRFCSPHRVVKLVEAPGLARRRVTR